MNSLTSKLSNPLVVKINLEFTIDRTDIANFSVSEKIINFRRSVDESKGERQEDSIINDSLLRPIRDEMWGDQLEEN